MRNNCVGTILGIGLALNLAFVAPLSAQGGQYGPFDYYNPGKGSISVVERYHMGFVLFKNQREKNWCAYWDNLDYTLRAFPNHPKALTLMAEYLNQHQPCQSGSEHRSAVELMREIERGGWREKNADYYFQTAITFRPQYAKTRILYARYLISERRHDEAIVQYQEALKTEPDAADAHYELGLLYFDKAEYAKARSHAERAYGLGNTRPDLRDKLTSTGHW